jgi:hypothetical protein
MEYYVFSSVQEVKTMIYKGIVNGKTIKLDEPLPYPKGQPVKISVEPLGDTLHPGSAMTIKQAMHEEPHLHWDDVDELEHLIEEGRLPVHQESAFSEA